MELDIGGLGSRIAAIEDSIFLAFFVAIEIFLESGVIICLGISHLRFLSSQIFPHIPFFGLHFYSRSFGSRDLRFIGSTVDENIFYLFFEFVIIEGTEFYKSSHVLPRSNVFRPIVSINFLEAIAHFFGNIICNPPHRAIVS